MGFDRQASAAWYRRNRARSRDLFDRLVPEAYYSRPIALRHPIVFYEGHLPGFSLNTLVKKGLGRPGIDARLEALFARGIDPHEAQATASDGAGTPDRAAEASGLDGWPSRDEVHRFADEADRRVIDAILHGDVDQPGHPLLDRAEAVFTILEHEQMHQETLLYMWHRLPFDQKRRPAGYRPRVEGREPGDERIRIPAGCATLGVGRGTNAFGWDNEFPATSAEVASFTIDRHDVTNARYLEFVAAGGYRDPSWWRADDWAWVQRESIAHPLFWERHDDRWHWRGMFDLIPLPPAWPVYVSQAEASAYARWRGARLAHRGGIPARGLRLARRASACTRGAAPSRTRRAASSISRVGIQSQSAPIPTVRARGASRIWSATAGNGRVRRSARFPGFMRWRPTRNTRPISSTASTWS